MTSKKQMKANSRACYVRDKAKHRLAIKARQLRIKDWWHEYKRDLKCSRCTENSPSCLDFHHVGDNKEFSVADAVHRGIGIARLLKEIAKCIVLCANCHRKEHSKARVV